MTSIQQLIDTNQQLAHALAQLIEQSNARIAMLEKRLNLLEIMKDKDGRD